MKIPQTGDIKLDYAVQNIECKPVFDFENAKRSTIADDMKKKGRKLSVKDKEKLEIEYYLTRKEKKQWNKYSDRKKQRILEHAMKSPEYQKFQEQLNSVPDERRHNVYGKNVNAYVPITGRNQEERKTVNQQYREQEKDESSNILTGQIKSVKIADTKNGNVQSTAETIRNTAGKMTENIASSASAGSSEIVKTGINATKKMADGAKRVLQNNSYDESAYNSQEDFSSNAAVSEKSMGLMQRIATIAATLMAFAAQVFAPIFFIAAIIAAIIAVITTLISIIFAPATIIKKAINALTTVSENVLNYETDVSSYAEEYGIKEYVPYLLAIMEVESHGEGEDVMQSSESLGLAPNSLSTDESIRQGVKYFSELIEKAQAEECDIDTAVQAYNYGSGFIDYVSENGKQYTFELAQEFAKEKSGGVITDYANDISVAENGGWRYLYGNMFYVRLIKKYVMIFNNEVIKNVFEEAVKYNGDDYEYGGSNPDEGFDCSGLTQWCFGQAGIYLPRTAQEQYDYVDHVELDEIIPGDLIFFTKTTPSYNYITHVGIYAGNGKIYEAGDPIGYYDFTDSWHQQHAVCGGRVVSVSDEENEDTQENVQEESPEENEDE